MIFIYIVMILLSCVPLVLFLVKRKRYRKILTEGTVTTAEVKNVVRKRMHKGGNYDMVHFWYLPTGANQYQAGQLLAKAGKYRGGNTFEVYYLPQRPEKYAVPGSKGEGWWVFFMLLLVALVVYACIKIDETVGAQKIYFNP